MEVDEAGHHDLVGRVDHASAGRVDGARRDLGDAIAVDHDGPAEVDLVGIVHRHDDAVRKDDTLAH